MAFLYDNLDGGANHYPIINVSEIPSFITKNIHPLFELRPYQKKALSRFMYYMGNSTFEGKQTMPYQLMFNMATGSGKTLIMAGLILYLYSLGYRRFLFFVNSTNIINKTIDNFINSSSSKYLFNSSIWFDNKKVNIKQVENFEDASRNDINIKFTTIQKLHSDIYTEKENSITIDDFKEKKIVFISDEAHHINTKTAKETEIESMAKPSWENTIERIFEQNSQNILLEFTATLDYQHKNIVEKYKPKVIVKYDLKEFRKDGYSKEINLLRSDFSDSDRILQAVILNQYKQDIALKYGIDFKPVILFKAQKLIAESLENKANFHSLIENLSTEQIKFIIENSKIREIKKAFRFYESANISIPQLIRKLQLNFAESNCYSVNEENLDKQSLRKEDMLQLIEQQYILNSLEDKNNPIRAIFAVNKLNEGWDVLNLFDIVRLYRTRDTKDSKAGKTTIAEAQLIGRGARYFPFRINVEQEKFKRKYDKPNHKNELKIIEELHYHTIEDSKYISELKQTLVEMGLMDNEHEYTEAKLFLKPEFMETDFYKKAVVFENKKDKNRYEKIQSFNDLGIKNTNFEFKLHSGEGSVTEAFDEKEVKVTTAAKPKGVKISEISAHIVKNALSKNEFFRFDKLKKYFPNLKSTNEFVSSENYLGGLEITFWGTLENVKNITNQHYYLAINKLLTNIKKQM